MLTIRDDYLDNYLSDKFVYLCHVDYLLKVTGQRPNIFVVIFIPLGIKFCIFIQYECICLLIRHSGQKTTIYQKKNQTSGFSL